MALAMIVPCTRASSSKPNPALSSIWSLNPPILPKPGTGGGGNIPTKPSGILLNFPIRLPAMAYADKEGS